MPESVCGGFVDNLGINTKLNSRAIVNGVHETVSSGINIVVFCRATCEASFVAREENEEPFISFSLN